MNASVKTAIVLAVLCFANSAIAANPNGKWESNVTFNNQPAESILKLRLDSEGSILTGFYIDGQDQRAVPITPALYTDDKVGFSVIRESNGQRVTIKYSGRLSGDTITGQSQLEVGGQVQTTDWVARRMR